MDPRSESDSFDTVGKTALLFHVNLHGRQIWSYEVEFGGADEEQRGAIAVQAKGYGG